MLILYVGTALIIWVLFRMVSGTIDRMRLKEFDRQIGALFGLAKGVLYCILITMFAVSLMGNNIREKIVQSRSGRYIAQVLDRSQAVIPTEIHDVVEPYLRSFDERFNESQNDGSLNPIPWMAQNQIQGQIPDPRGGQPAVGQTFGTQFQSDSRLPTTNPQQPWAPPQQARQQPPWNGFQR